MRFLHAWGVAAAAPRSHCSELCGEPPGTDEQARAARAVQLVQLGELSAAARRTADLRDPDRRPPAAQVPLWEGVLGHRPTAACPLPATVLLHFAGAFQEACLRTSLG